MEKGKMMCPECGIEMNHHADKLDYTAAFTNPDQIDPELGGVLEEMHSCPACGKTEMRVAR